MDVLIVGDGPGGLSAALFLAKAGKKVVVVGRDETAMNWAMLHNYLGIEQMAGTDFQAAARRQVEAKGATIRNAKVASLAAAPGGGFVATLEGGEELSAPVVVLSEGKSPVLARALGCAGGTSIEVDAQGLTSVPGVYAVGRMVRPGRSQAIISAGDGAKAALDILARESGRDVQDWDSPPKG